MVSTNYTMDRGAPAEATFGAYAKPLAAAALGHAFALEDGSGAETLHKLRVALRRMRTPLCARRPILDEKIRQ
jgi:CHAD domain-containing protein